ncbi:MAG: hypothetical protein ACI4VK_04850 [Candidatus Coproplasma sp.]
MNKKLKIASIAVSAVMVGSMAFGMFGCSSNSGGTGGGTGGGSSASAQFEGTDENAAKIKSAVSTKLNYATYLGLCNTAYSRLVSKEWVDEGGTAQTKKTVATSVDNEVSIRFNVGDKSTRSITYNGLITGTITLPNGDTASDQQLKPVWADILETINDKTPGSGAIKFEDKYFTDSGKIPAIVKDEAKNLSDYDIITDGVTNVALYQDQLLDLSLYMDEMPNYAAFLEANPTVKDSLTFNGGSMYYAPYFDGYNDVEKYSLFKNNWVEALLDNTNGGDTTQTWAASMTAKGKTANKSSIQSYMGKTGSWNTDVLDKDGNEISGGITINYDKALSAAKGTTGLGAAVSTAAGKAYDGTSGNIVDIMNFVIDAKEGDVTGAQLLSIMQEYIKVAYYVGQTDTAFYTQTGYKLSDVFTGLCAAWDVDLFAALGRVMITNPTLLKSGSATVGATGATALKDVYLVTPREQNMQRGSDVISWIGELYGIRGLESRYGYAYINENNLLQDARGNESSYRAAKAFNAFYDEGLVFPASEKPSDGKNGSNSYYYQGTIETMAMHDYLNTQTPAGFKVSGDTNQVVYDGVEDGYNFTANLTAVSKWDEDGSNQIEADEYFRFTESWRSVKDSGICVPLASVANNPEKLKVILTFIDYIFSEDGQIMMAYGAPAASANGDGGFWYNPEVTTETIANDGSVTVNGTKYKGTFTFNGKTYASDTYYGKRYNPTLTQKTLDAYTAKDVNGYKYDGSKGSSATDANNWKTSCVMSYTDFARFVMGSALNFGNKLTSLEYQMTSDMGKAGAEKVDLAVGKDIIRHVTPALEEGQSKWYAIVPTSLPFTNTETANDSALAKDCSDLYQKGTQDTIFTIHKSSATNLYYEIIKYGYDFTSYANTFSTLGLNN